jgi:hypothetical protein
MENPDPEALDALEDLLSEEQWLRSQAPPNDGLRTRGTSSGRTDRLGRVEQELDRCAELLRRRGGDRNSQHTFRSAPGT